MIETNLMEVINKLTTYRNTLPNDCIEYHQITRSIWHLKRGLLAYGLTHHSEENK